MKRFLSALLAVLLLTALPACGSLEKKAPVRVSVLSGTTGFGMANLMDASAKKEAEQDYSFTVETDASNVTASLVNGSVDIAALPTNAAAAVYNKTQGGVQVLALNTLGVLYLLTDGSVTVEAMADLAGKTVYVPAQNPTFIFEQLVRASGVSDVTVDNTYAQPADLNAAVAAGKVALAVLPEPMVTIARSKNPALQVALDLTEQWDRYSPPGSLVQGCVVVRKRFAEENPKAVETFLREYGASIQTMLEDAAGTAEKIQANGIFTNAAVAAKAIPNCNVCFITGKEMKAALGEFLRILLEIAPASLGGKLPGDDFYYLVNG